MSNIQTGADQYIYHDGLLERASPYLYDFSTDPWRTCHFSIRFNCLTFTHFYCHRIWYVAKRHSVTFNPQDLLTNSCLLYVTAQT
jgi:hypothetical protein